MTLSLLTVNSTLTVSVFLADGQTAAEGAQVRVRRMGVPVQQAEQIADADGRALFVQLTEGSYAVDACLTVEQTRLCRTETTDVASSTAGTVTLRLQESGTIEGLFVEADGVTPVDLAQVTIGDVAYAVTSTDGRFREEGIPLGVHALLGRNAVTGRAAQAQARLSYDGEVAQVLLREDPLGDVTGRVFDVDQVSIVPAANVKLSPSSPLFEAQAVTTGPQGEYFFVAVPPGPFIVSANDPRTPSTGFATATMPDVPETVDVPIFFEPRGSILARVFQSDGSLARASANVGLRNQTIVGTSEDGEARLTRLVLGNYSVFARSSVPGRTRSVGSSEATVTQAGLEVPVDIRLSGVGTISGTVNQNGAPLGNAAVRARFTIATGREQELALSDLATGAFAFSNLPVGEVEVEATSGPFSARSIVDVSDGQTADVSLTLVTTATVVGQLVRADRTTPVRDAVVTLEYDALSGLAQTVTDSEGRFVFAGVPAGGFTIRSSVAEIDGVLSFVSSVPGPLDPQDANVIDVGALIVDEERPTISQAFPVDGATEVSGDVAVQLTFSEPMDPAYDDVRGAYLSDGISRVPATLSWTGPVGLPPDTLVITPDSPLASETTYSVVILAGEQIGANGSIIARGPTDLVGRFTPTTFIFRFTTRDTNPPQILSFTPEDSAEQIPQESVIRVSFDEPIDAQTASLLLLAADGTPISGSQTVGLDRRVIVFTPEVFLPLNTTFEAQLINAQDDAGNLVVGLPVIRRFASTDTIGPIVADLDTVPPGRGIVAGEIAPLTATLAGAPEPDVQLELTTDLQTFSRSAIGTLTASVPAGAEGALLVRARAYDRFGNVGPWYEETFDVGPNEPPVVTIAQTRPPQGLTTNETFEIEVSATDDAAVGRIRATVDGLPVSITEEVTNETSLILAGAIPADYGPDRSLTVTAEAVDAVGLSATAELVVPIGDGTPPTVSVDWPPPYADAGTTLTIPVAVSDNFGAAILTMERFGVLTGIDGGPLVPPRTEYSRDFQVPVPPQLPPGSVFRLVVATEDERGIRRALSQQFQVSVAGAPTVASAEPSAGATDVSTQTTITIVFSEPVINPTTELAISPPPPGDAPSIIYNDESLTAVITPDEGLAPGTTYTVVFGDNITDLAGNRLSAPAPPITFTTIEATVAGPRIIDLRPADTSTNTPLNLVIEYTFDAPIAGPLPTDLMTLTEDVSGAPPIAVTETWLDSGRRYRATVPPEALSPGTTYRASFAAQTLQDSDGNTARDPRGQTLTAPFDTTFTTAAIQVVVDSWTGAGTPRVVAGHPARLGVNAQSAADIERTAWRVDGAFTEAPDSIGRRPRQRVAVPDLTAGSTIDFGATVQLLGGGRFDLTPVVATAESPAADFDGDGISNGDEVRFGLDPWRSEDATQDPDGDGRTNAQEVADGTDPFADESLGNRRLRSDSKRRTTCSTSAERTTSSFRRRSAGLGLYLGNVGVSGWLRADLCLGRDEGWYQSRPRRRVRRTGPAVHARDRRQRRSVMGERNATGGLVPSRPELRRRALRRLR